MIAFLGLKAVELIGRVESWPLSRVEMFSRYRPPAAVPWRVTLEATRDGTWWPLEPGHLGLTPDEMLRRLQGDAAAISRGCGVLRRAFDAAHPPAARLRAVRARVRRVPRPGVGGGPGAAEVLLPCP